MAIAGMAGTGSWGTNERPKHFRETILFLRPDGSAPLTALLSKMDTEKVDDPEFHWWEEKLQTMRVAINYSTGYSNSATQLVVDSAVGLDAQDLVVGDVLLHEPAAGESATAAEEFMQVLSVDSATTITVSRGAANTTAVALTDNDGLTKVGNAFEQGSLSANASSRNPTQLLNYTQIFKHAFQITRTATQTKARTGKREMRDKTRKMFQHAAAMEWAFLYGKKYLDTTGIQPKYFTGGLRSFLSTNVKVYTTTPTEDDFITTVSPVFDWDGDGESTNERLFMCGNGFLTSLNKLVRNSSSTQIQFQDVIEVYGMSLTRVVIPQGTFYFKTHPLLNVHPRYKYSAFIIDPTAITYRPIQDTVYQRNIQPNDADYVKHQWLTEAGIEVHHEETMGYIGNFLVQ